MFPSCCTRGGHGSQRYLVPGVNNNVIEYGTDTTRAIMSLVVINATDLYPDIRFSFSHGGGTMPYLIEQILGCTEIGSLTDPSRSNARLKQLRQFYYDTANVNNVVAMTALKEVVGVSQIMFGTDFPYEGAVLQQEMDLRGSGAFSAEELKMILVQTPAALQSRTQHNKGEKKWKLEQRSSGPHRRKMPQCASVFRAAYLPWIPGDSAHCGGLSLSVGRVAEGYRGICHWACTPEENIRSNALPKDPIGAHRAFIQAVVIPHPAFFGHLVAYGELAIGLSLIFGFLVRTYSRRLPPSTISTSCWRLPGPMADRSWASIASSSFLNWFSCSRQPGAHGAWTAF